MYGAPNQLFETPLNIFQGRHVIHELLLTDENNLVFVKGTMIGLKY